MVAPSSDPPTLPAVGTGFVLGLEQMTADGSGRQKSAEKRQLSTMVLSTTVTGRSFPAQP
jgi:hypothetical protein